MSILSRTRTIFFGLILGLTSASFAEVPLMHSPSLLFNPSRLVVTGSIYLFHVLFFVTLLIRFQLTSFAPLYLTGILFGLYEAYITKVVWTPVGDPIPITFLSIHWVETFFLVFFWHPVFSLIIPVVLSEETCSQSSTFRSIPIIRSLIQSKPVLLTGSILFLGLLQGAVSSSIMVGLKANLLSFGLLLIAVVIWRNFGLHQAPLKELLPEKSVAKWLFLLLILLYGILGTNIRYKHLPTNSPPHIPILVLYLLAVSGIYFAARSTAHSSRNTREKTNSLHPYFVYFFVYMAASITATYFPTKIKNMIFLLFYGSSIFGGLLLLVYCILELFGRSPLEIQMN